MWGGRPIKRRGALMDNHRNRAVTTGRGALRVRAGGHASRGFTLIEIVVAVAIIATIAAFAAPSYTHFVVRGKLVEAAAVLPELAARLEKTYLDQRTYSTDGASCDVAMPAGSEAKYFSYSCAPLNNGREYLLTASSRDGVGLGGASDYVYTLHQSGARTTETYAGQDLSNNNVCWLLGDTSAC